VIGYWLVELYASLSRKNPLPVLLGPFSHEEPYSPGQNPVVLAAVHKIFELTGNRGVLVVDRGLDGFVMFEDQPLPDDPDFLSYRLLGGLTEAINTCFWLHKDLLRRSLG
jgi:hypothetical protein